MQTSSDSTKKSKFYRLPNGRYQLHKDTTKPCNVCCALDCHRKRQPKKQSFCWTCISHLRYLNNPNRVAYETLKKNARRRKKVFGITYSEYLYLLALKPSHEHCLDRIDPTRGYLLDNLQWLTRSENTHKQNTTDQDYLNPTEYNPFDDPDYVPDFGIPDYDPNCPF